MPVLDVEKPVRREDTKVWNAKEWARKFEMRSDFIRHEHNNYDHLTNEIFIMIIYILEKHVAI